jgi:ABC-type polysaccharide/polyol phosphate transport system ATPase subunit
MSDRPSVVRIKDLSKTFPRGHYSTLFNLVKRNMPGNGNRAQNIEALSNINLEIFKGEKVGVIGNNGAGKSTFLKLVAGLHKPSGGNVSVCGEVALLTGFGIGLVDELTVSENVFLYGAIHGMERQRVKKKFEDIIEWAELENFRQMKLKALSSGMAARLAFSVARHIETELVLLDEALTAGDKNFGLKCEQYFRDVKNAGRTFLVATHDLKFVREFCDKALWLHKGQQAAFGDAKTVMQQYSNS